MVSTCVLVIQPETTLSNAKKLSIQNRAACENRGKKCKLNDHWKSMKHCFRKTITGDDAKKMKRLTQIQVFTKDLDPTKSDIRF